MCRRWILHYAGEQCRLHSPRCTPSISLTAWCHDEGTAPCAEAWDAGPFLVAAPMPCPNHLTRSLAGLRQLIHRWHRTLHTTMATVLRRRIGRRGRRRVLRRQQTRKLKLLHPLVQERLRYFARGVMADLRSLHARIAARYWLDCVLGPGNGYHFRRSHRDRCLRAWLEAVDNAAVRLEAALEVFPRNYWVPCRRKCPPERFRVEVIRIFGRWEAMGQAFPVPGHQYPRRRLRRLVAAANEDEDL